MTLSRPPPPADDLTQVAARRTRSRRSDAPKQNETRVRRRSTILPVARTGRQSRRPRRFWNTPRASNYRPTSCHHSSTPAQCWTSFNGLLRWSDCRLHHQRYQDTTGLRRLSSKLHVRPFQTDHLVDISEHVSQWARARYIYSRAVA